LDARSESPRGSPPRDPPGFPAAKRRVPAGAVAGEIREKGPTRVQSRRRQTAVPDPLHRTRLPPTARERTPRPRGNPTAARRHTPAREAHRGRGGPARRAANAPPASGGGERRATGRLLPSRGTCPAPLRTPAVHLGDLLRIWVRPGARFTPSPRIFKGQRELTGRRRNHGPVVRPEPRGAGIPPQPARAGPHFHCATGFRVSEPSDSRVR
uniref:Uncharacterized protein n=1 Tax=Scophthalmus maximus TaxID=52904 RepID=A0A8D3DH60_SCOMX